MLFSADERKKLLALKGVGASVVVRLEQVGIESLEQLARQDAEEVINRVAEAMASDSWKRAPQARATMEAVIAFAQAETNKSRS